MKFLTVIVIDDPAEPELGLNDNVAGPVGCVVAVGGTEVFVGGTLVGGIAVGGMAVGGTVVVFVGSGGGWVGTTPAPALGVDVDAVEPPPEPEPEPPVEPDPEPEPPVEPVPAVEPDDPELPESLPPVLAGGWPPLPAGVWELPSPCAVAVDVVPGVALSAVKDAAGLAAPPAVAVEDEKTLAAGVRVPTALPVDGEPSSPEPKPKATYAIAISPATASVPAMTILAETGGIVVPCRAG